MNAVRSLFAALVAAGALVACRQAEPPAPAAPPVAAASAAGGAEHEAGRKIYNFRCYYCHGYSGDARTLAASFMSPAPRNFQATPADALPREAMLRAVAGGVPGTAMAAFGNTLAPREIELVVDFVREEFLRRKARNTAYHTAENGWPDHERYRSAYPFATGEIPVDRPWDDLDAAQARGKRLYLSACVSCHDRGRVESEGRPWELRSVSYPPGNYDGAADETPARAPAGAARSEPAPPPARTPFELHEIAPRLHRPSAQVLQGEKVYQDNCAYCHAPDGTGRNWIGSFLEPHPPDFTAPEHAGRMSRERVAAVTREGMPGTSMPAWKAVLAPAEIDAVAAYVTEVFVTGAARAKPAARAATAR